MSACLDPVPGRAQQNWGPSAHGREGRKWDHQSRVCPAPYYVLSPLQLLRAKCWRRGKHRPCVQHTEGVPATPRCNRPSSHERFQVDNRGRWVKIFAHPTRSELFQGRALDFDMHPHHSRVPTLCPVSRGDWRSELTREARGRLWTHRATMQHSRGRYCGKDSASGARQAWI